jgi:hypothetical protein
LPLPGLSPTHPSANPSDITLHLGIPLPFANNHPSSSEALTYKSAESNAAGEPALRILKVGRSGFVRIAYGDGTEFWLDGKLENVWATWSNRSSLENTVLYLIGPVFGLLLRLRGVTCLHASAVAFGNYCVAFVGTTGAGKSTIAAAFARQGYATLSDDLVALSEREGTFQVMPGYPRLCLWPESVETLYGSAEALPRIIPDEEKRVLAPGTGEVRFETRPLQLAAIYILGERRLHPAPYVEATRARPALLSLVVDTFANKILDPQMRAHEFDVLSRLVSSVPVRRLFPSSDPSRIFDLCRVIQEDIAALRVSARTHP